MRRTVPLLPAHLEEGVGVLALPLPTPPLQLMPLRPLDQLEAAAVGAVCSCAIMVLEFPDNKAAG